MMLPLALVALAIIGIGLGNAWLVGDVLGIYHTMDNFTGRKK